MTADENLPTVGSLGLDIKGDGDEADQIDEHDEITDDNEHLPTRFIGDILKDQEDAMRPASERSTSEFGVPQVIEPASSSSSISDATEVPHDHQVLSERMNGSCAGLHGVSPQPLPSLTMSTPDNSPHPSNDPLLPRDDPKSRKSHKPGLLHRATAVSFLSLPQSRSGSETHRDQPQDSDANDTTDDTLDRTITPAYNLSRGGTMTKATVLKSERMLVRYEFTRANDLPDAYDEQASNRYQRHSNGWREYVVELLPDHLQILENRRIPFMDRIRKRLHSVTSLELNSRLHLSLYSSLDKSFALVHTDHRGTQIYIFKLAAPSSANEWYMSLYRMLNKSAPQDYDIRVPDLHIRLRLPLNVDLAKVRQIHRDRLHHHHRRRRRAKKLDEDDVFEISQDDIVLTCMEMFGGYAEWADILKLWNIRGDMGLCWKRYDRLEWISQAQVAGSGRARADGVISCVAVAKTHELELRPREHYPTSTVILDEVTGHPRSIMEPAPVEGFLVRLRSKDNGRIRRGRTAYQRGYYTVHDHLLLYCKPSKAALPPPPVGVNVDSYIYTVSPFTMNEECLTRSSKRTIGTVQARRPVDDYVDEENERRQEQIMNADGFVDLIEVEQVDFVQHGDGQVIDKEQESFDDINESATFELRMKNGSLVRLQSYSRQTAVEWISRLNGLIRYWRHKVQEDVFLRMAIQKANGEVFGERDQLEGEEAKETTATSVALRASAQSIASPIVWNWCMVQGCRGILKRGVLYRKSTYSGTFIRQYFVLVGTTLLAFEVHPLNGESHMHGHGVLSAIRSKPHSSMSQKVSQHRRLSKQRFTSEECGRIDLAGAYIYSGVSTENDMPYVTSSNTTTGRANGSNGHSTARLYPSGLMSVDDEIECTFTIWKPTVIGAESDRNQRSMGGIGPRPLGRKGKAVVFRAMNRQEREEWVVALGLVMERIGQESDKSSN